MVVRPGYPYPIYGGKTQKGGQSQRLTPMVTHKSQSLSDGLAALMFLYPEWRIKPAPGSGSIRLSETKRCNFAPGIKRLDRK